MSSIPFNTTGYNIAGLNTPASNPNAAPTALLTFDDFNCDDGTYMKISTIKYNSGHRRDIDQFSIPRANGIRVSNMYEREKIITADGLLKADTAELLETYIDTVKKNLRQARQQLVTVWAGQTRLYEHATLMNADTMFEEREHYHINIVPFTLQFLCEDISTDWDYEQWTGEITAADDTVAATGDGTTEGKPVIIVIFSAASGVTSLTVAIDENDNQIGYSGALAAGDYLVFDCENETVTLNGVAVDFTGYFPKMALGDNTFRFTTNGSSRTYRATVKSKHAYL
jgi:phage-related protein